MIKHFKKIIHLTLTMIFILGLSGPGYTDTDAEPKIPTSPLSEQRIDIQAVTHALVYKLQGSKHNGIGAVMFGDAFGTLSDGTGLDYREFRLTKVLITKDYNPQSDPKYRALSFVAEFTDPGLRVALVQFSATYYLGDELIFLEKASAEPVYSDFYDVNLFFVPSDQLPDTEIISAMGYPAFIEMLYEKSIPYKSLQSIKPGKMSRIAIFAVSRIRYEKTALLSLYISNDDDENFAISQKTLQVNFDGWPVVMTKGIFILNTEPGFILNTVIERQHTDETREAVVNRFNSFKKL